MTTRFRSVNSAGEQPTQIASDANNLSCDELGATEQGVNTKSADGFDGISVRPTNAVELTLASMTLEQKVRRLLMVYGDVNVLPPSGAIVVNQTHLTATSAPKLDGALRAAEKGSGIPVLVAADQEGGAINQLGRLPATANLTFPSSKQMAGMTLEQIRAEGVKTGKAMAAAHLTCLLGPCLDVASPGSLMDKMGRSFGGTSDEVVARANAFIEGLRQGNPSLVLIGKHFPGYDVQGNSDFTLVTDNSSPEVIAQRASAYDRVRGLDGIMVSSVRYPALDSEPPCFSTKIIDWLREKSPEAIVMTDDLCGAALYSEPVRAYKQYLRCAGKAKTSSSAAQELAELQRKFPELKDAAGRKKLATQLEREVRDNVKKAFLAGADVLILMDGAKAQGAASALTELIQQRPELQGRLDDAVRRILNATLRPKGVASSAPGVSLPPPGLLTPKPAWLSQPAGPPIRIPFRRV